MFTVGCMACTWYSCYEYVFGFEGVFRNEIGNVSDRIMS